MLKNQKGFTIIELLLAVVLLVIAIGLGYQLLFYAQNNFERSENHWNRQNQVIALSAYIADVIDKSLYVDIATEIDDIDTYDGAIYVEEDGTDILLQNGTLSTETIGENLDISFAKVVDINGNNYSDLLEITVTASDVNYYLTTKVKIENMVEDRRIVGDATGDVLIFRTQETVAEVPITIESCYIATAANGSKMEPSVMLLRRFRDQVLLKSYVGTKFVDFYYSHAPKIASAIAGNNTLRFVTRVALLPLVGVATMLLQPLLLLIVAAAMWFAIYISTKKKTRYLVL